MGKAVLGEKAIELTDDYKDIFLEIAFGIVDMIPTPQSVKNISTQIGTAITSVNSKIFSLISHKFIYCS